MKHKKNVRLSDDSKDTINSVYIPRHPKYGVSALAKIYNVSPATICNVLKGRVKYEN